MSTNTYIALSVAEGVALVVILMIALTRIRERLVAIASGLATLASALSGVERDLKQLDTAVPQINRPLQAIAGALPEIAEKAELTSRWHDRRNRAWHSGGWETRS
jgi:hypothetical protein